MEEKFIKLLKKEGIHYPENPTESDVAKIVKLNPDNNIIQEYYQYLAGVLPNIVTIVTNLASNSLGKDTINSFNKRIDALNERYKAEKDIEILKLIREEIADIYDRIEKESDKQRAWLSKLAYGVAGTIIVLGGIGIGLKNKEAGKKIAEEGIKLLKS